MAKEFALDDCVSRMEQMFEEELQDFGGKNSTGEPEGNLRREKQGQQVLSMRKNTL